MKKSDKMRKLLNKKSIKKIEVNKDNFEDLLLASANQALDYVRNESKKEKVSIVEKIKKRIVRKKD
jgi:hypothetical protein